MSKIINRTGRTIQEGELVPINLTQTRWPECGDLEAVDEDGKIVTRPVLAEKIERDENGQPIPSHIVLPG